MRSNWVTYGKFVIIGRAMGRITHLPESLIGHLRSSSILSDLAQAVEELICNSLDAGARKVCASVDLDSFYIKVEDDGVGISRDDLTLIGERHATSKLHDLVDLESGIATLGFRGEALSSLSDIAILEITSRIRGSPNVYKKILKGSKKLSLGLCSEQQTPGTKVVLRDLFHNLPVRRKVIQSSPRKVLQAVKDRALRLALIHPDVSLTVIDLGRQENLIHTKSCVSSLDTLCDFFGEDLRCHLQELSYAKGNFKLCGFVSKDTCFLPSKAIQFLYLNRRFVHKTPMHKLVNLYSSVTTGLNGAGNSYVGISVPETRSSMPDAPSALKYPAFFLDLSCPLSSYDITFEATKTSVEFKDWGSVLSFVQEALETVWISSTRDLDKGGKEVLTERGVGISTKSQKRKSWQIIDPTYKARCKIDVPKSCMLDCEPGLANFGLQSTDFDIGTSLQEPLFYPPKRPKSARRRKEYNPSVHPKFCNEPASCWDLQPCVQTRSRHLKDSSALRSQTKQSSLKNRADFLVDEHTETNDFVGLCHKNSGRSSIEYRKPEEIFEEDLQLDDTSSSSLCSFSTASINISPLHFNISNFHKTREGTFLDSISNQPASSLFSREQDEHSMYVDREEIKAMEYLQSPSTLGKPMSISSNSARRCLYDLDIMRSSTNDFLCHSERQTVCNLEFREDTNRLEQLMENIGPFGSSLCRIASGIPSSKTLQWKLDPSFGSHDGHCERELGAVGEFCFDNQYKSSLLGSCSRLTPPLQTQHIDLDILNSRSMSKNFKTDAGEDGDAFVWGQLEKHISSKLKPQESSKNHLQRSLSAPPFYKPVKNHAVLIASRESCFKSGKDKQDVEKARPEKLSKNISQVEQAKPAADLCCNLLSEKRTFQGAAVVQGEEPNGILAVKDLSSPQENSGYEKCESNRNEHCLCNLHHVHNDPVEMTAVKLYKEWRNPFLKINERDILDLSSGFLGPNNKHLLPESISKEELQSARVLQQFGKKFIAIVAQGNLVVVDQHAADERVRLEQLRKEVLAENKKQLSTFLDCPQELGLTGGDQELLHTYRGQIEDWGWRFKVLSAESGCYDRRHGRAHQGSSVVLLNAVPHILGESLNDKQYLSEYLRQLSVTDGTSAPPPAVLRVLTSKSCRGAIMFGDYLLRSECQQLIEELKQTSLCFQCAHGRPTLVPLVNLQALRRRLHRLHGFHSRNSSEALCELVSVDQSCSQSEVSKSGTGYEIVWHRLQRHRATLERAQERLSCAEGI